MPDPIDLHRRRWSILPDDTPHAVPRPSRLEKANGSELHPFSRAVDLKDISLYWLPVTIYPLRSRERQWLMVFLTLLRDTLSNERKLRIESFLQFKALDNEAMKLFLDSSREFMPLGGLSIRPGYPLPKPPSYEQLEQAVKAGGPIDVGQWTPDYCYWFMVREDERQRELFFGLGALMFLFLQQDPETTPPKLPLPRYLQTHPAMQGKDIEREMKVGYSLKEKFLKQSKELFGKSIKDDSSYAGLTFIMPLLSSEDFLRAHPEERAQWFELFDAYCVESVADKGFLLAVKDADFDQTLIRLLGRMHEMGLEYPL